MTVQKLLTEALLRVATFEIDCEPEDASIEGNCSAIDPETDAATAAAIREQLDSGNDWAWCWVRVRATHRRFTGSDTLGCCSYASRADFMADGYYADMQREACSQIAAMLVEAEESIDDLLTVAA